MQSVSLPSDPAAHNFSGEITVGQNATRTEKGTYVDVCTLCGEQTIVGYFDAPPYDADGNGRIDISDVTRMLNILAQSDDAIACACEPDFNDDGVISVKDLTWLLLVLAGEIG